MSTTNKPSLPQFDSGETEEQKTEKLRMFVDELTRWVEDVSSSISGSGDGYPPQLGHARI